MATAKAAAKAPAKATKAAPAPAAKAAAKPAAKAAPAPAAKAAAKAPAAAKTTKKAAAPAVPTEPAVGVIVEFLGYDANVPAEEQIIEVGYRGPILEIDSTGDTPAYIVRVPNPDFNPEEDENADTNPAEIETGLYDGEFAISADQTPINADAAPVETPAAEPVKNGRAKAKAAPAAPAAAEEVVEAEPELENEDPDVVALIDGAANTEEGLIGLALDLEADIESKNYQLGGVLYHVKKDKSYESLKPEYAENNGFALFVEETFQFSYRKAMNLIEIYYNVNRLGLENPAQLVAELGWTKMSKLAPIMESDNVDELIELARANTVMGLTEAIKTSTVEVGGTPGDKKTRTTIKLRYFEDEANDIVAFLTETQESQGLKTLEEAFSFVVSEYRLSQGSEAPVEEAPTQAAPARAAGKAPATAAKPAARRATATA